MSSDYSKKKNAELEDLLKARSLPHTGKKADLIARLVQHDAQKSTPTPAPTPAPAPAPAPTASTAPADDEIDWDDEAIVDTPPSAPVKSKAPPVAAASSATGVYALASGGIGPISNPTAVPNQVVATDPSTTHDLTVSAPVPGSGPKAEAKAEADPSKTVSPDPAPPPPPTDYSRNVPRTDLETELAKRKARALRFGLVESESNTDTIKALERAKRFGTGTLGDVNGLKALDKPLTEKRTGQGKRGRAEDGQDAPNKRVDSGRSQERRGGRSQERGGRRGAVRKGNSGQRNGGGGGGRRGRSGQRDRGADRTRSQNRLSLSEKDRWAAEARKKRFAAAA